MKGISQKRSRIRQGSLEALEARQMLAAQMLHDINDEIPTSLPQSLTAVGDALFLYANDGVHGHELWKSDGTPAGTFLVKDICRGPDGSEFSPEGIGFKNKYYFGARSDQFGPAIIGTELWVSDGTAAGTYMLKDIAPGQNSSSPAEFAVAGDTLYFTATGPGGDRELWKTDGTESGTQRVKDTRPSGSGSPTDLVVVGDILYFTALAQSNDRELWRSDGTEAGTYMLKDIRPNMSASIDNLIAVGSQLYFTADDGIHGNELWSSDGTAAGTVVHDINPGSGGSIIFGKMAALGDRLIFNATVTGYGEEPWITNDSALGASLLKDIRAGAGTSSPTEFEVFNGKVYFTAAATGSEYELWVSDGTPVGTSLVIDLVPGAGSSSPYRLTSLGSSLLFAARTSEGDELWRTDGTAQGTARISNIAPGNVILTLKDLVRAGDKVYFSVNEPLNGDEVWVSDGTLQGTHLTRDIANGTAGSAPRDFVPYAGKTYFTAADRLHKAELWATDGAQAGTNLFKDIYPGVSASGAKAATSAGGKLLIFATTELGVEPWISDGTPEGTTLLKDIYPGSASGASLAEYARVGDMVVFTGYNPDTGRELWRTDGTPDGTVLIANVTPGAGSSNPAGLVAANGSVFLTFNFNFSQSELWRTDGFTLSRVHPTPMPVTNAVAKPVAGSAGGLFYFRALASGYGTELWKSDGTEAGTAIVKDIGIGTAGSDPYGIADLNGALMFFAHSAAAGRELWRSDGTADGTYMVRDILPGNASAIASSGHDLVTHDSVVYFPAITAEHGRELWRSDGTAEGTYLLKDIWPGSNDALIGNLVSFGDHLYFTADDGIHGRELWRTDGTAAGTVLVQDIIPGTPSSNTQNLTGSNNALYFGATDGTSGIEPWTFVDTPPTVLNSSFAYDVSPNELRIRFSEDVSATLGLDDILVRTRSGASPPQPVSFTYDPATHTARFRFEGVLPDGEYTATLVAAGIRNRIFTPMTLDHTIDFWQLSGDANRDRAVTFGDLLTVAANFGAVGDWSSGDFDLDGTIGFTDLLRVSASFGNQFTLPAAAALPSLKSPRTGTKLAPKVFSQTTISPAKKPKPRISVVRR